MPTQKTAYVTGGASGIGLAVVNMLVSRHCLVALADINYAGAKAAADSINPQPGNEGMVIPFELDSADWDSQLKVFQEVVQTLQGRVDYVYPIAGIGERVSLPRAEEGKGFVKPELSVLDVDLYGFVYTTSLAIQQMRRQSKDGEGYRGKIATVASVCGFYCVPTLPIYTAAKHGVVGYVRSFGKYLLEEGVTLNAVCPNVVRTNISSGAFYEQIEAKGLLTPMKPVIEAFEQFLDGDESGECMEAGPKGDLVRRAPAEHLDAESKEVMEMLYHRGWGLHQPKS